MADTKQAADEKKRAEAAAKQQDQESADAAKQRQKITDAANQLRDALIESGVDESSADAMIHSAIPNDPSVGIVGNYADLQRAGGAAHTSEQGGLAAIVPEPQAVVTTAPDAVPEDKK